MCHAYYRWWLSFLRLSAKVEDCGEDSICDRCTIQNTTRTFVTCDATQYAVRLFWMYIRPIAEPLSRNAAHDGRNNGLDLLVNWGRVTPNVLKWLYIPACGCSLYFISFIWLWTFFNLSAQQTTFQMRCLKNYWYTGICLNFIVCLLGHHWSLVI